MKTKRVWCLAILVGCGSQDQAVHTLPVNIGDTAVSQTALSDEDIRNSAKWSRFPDDSVGQWLSGDDAARVAQLSNIQFHTSLPLPSIGYVPLGCSGPTVSAEVHNDSGDFLADIELIVTATNMQSGQRLAEMKTETMIPYRLTPPHSVDGREALLGDILEPDSSPFAGADDWPPFTIHATVNRIRLADEQELLAYHRKREAEAFKARTAHKGDYDP